MEIQLTIQYELPIEISQDMDPLIFSFDLHPTAPD